MQHGIVEGEPGIFPQPIADIMRKIGGLFTRRRRPEPPPTPAPAPDDTEGTHQADDDPRDPGTK